MSTRNSRNRNRNKGSTAGVVSSARSVKTPTTIEECVYHLGSANQAAEYETITSFIINHVRKEYQEGDDVATALETGEELDLLALMPVLQFSERDDKDPLRKREDRQFEKLFDMELQEYSDKKKEYNRNKSQVYALLMERCSPGLRQKIEGSSNFKTEVKKNPIKLLQAIKQQALNYQEDKYTEFIWNDAVMAFLNCKQREGETLQDYTSRFKTARELLVSQNGIPVFSEKSVEGMKDYDEKDSDAVAKCKLLAFKRHAAAIYLRNSDQAKYGSVLKNFHFQFSVQNDQYPKSVTLANAVLSSHPFDNAAAIAKQRNNQSKRSNENNKSESKDTIVERNDDNQLLKGRCYCCGKEGHKSPSCRYKDKPKEEWAFAKLKNQAQSFLNSEESDDDEEDDNVSAITNPTVATTRSVKSTKTSMSKTSSSSGKGKKNDSFGWNGANVETCFV